MPTEPKDPVKTKNPLKTGDEEAFLSRWSRRKRTEPDDTAGEPSAEVPADPADDLTDEELLADLDLPDPDAMKANDDFSAFMQARVPERLRRRALRVLWRSNPVLANLDELVDYGEDYTDAATVMENMQTVYEVGKGAAEKWKRHLAALAAAEEDDDTPEPPPVFEVAARPEQQEQPDPEPAELPVPAPEPLAPVMTDSAPADLPPPRHMRFAFD